MAQPGHSSDDMPTFWDACASNDMAQAAVLIDTLHPSPHDLSQGLTCAAAKNQVAMARFLLERGASFDGYCIKEAARAGSITMLDLFSEFGWDMNSKLSGGGAVTALLFAVNNPPLVAYLLCRGANPNLGPAIGPGIGHPDRFRLVPDSGANLQAAAKCGNIESFDLLLAHGAALQNAAALHAAVEGGNIDMVRHVLKIGGNVDERDSLKTMGYYFCGTPLYRAIMKRRFDLVKILLEYGAAVRIKGRNEKTPLELAMEEGLSEELGNLIEATAKSKESLATALPREK
ncbi:MAG: hypothetical protein Q9227_009575 [Pyrenula ochraceoflavens]